MTEILTAERALELLDAAVADRGANHRYPTKKVGVGDDGHGTFARYYEPEADELGRDYAEASACHYFATERDAALVKSVEQGAPMCIVGWVLDALGVTVDDLTEGNPRGNIEAAATVALAHAESAGKIALSEDPEDRGRVRDLLTIAQGQQDGGSTWGQAVEVARKQIDQPA